MKFHGLYCDFLYRLRLTKLLQSLAQSTRELDLLKFSGYLWWFQKYRLLHVYIFNSVWQQCKTCILSKVIKQVVWMIEMFCFLLLAAKMQPLSVSDIKSPRQPACHKEQKTCKRRKYECYGWMWCITKCVLCTVYYNVMFTCTLARSHPEGKKTLGETWATVIKAMNSILWTGVATRYPLARMGAELSSVYALRGPWRTYSQGASRRPMFKYVHYLVYMYCSVM